MIVISNGGGQKRKEDKMTKAEKKALRFSISNAQDAKIAASIAAGKAKGDTAGYAAQDLADRPAPTFIDPICNASYGYHYGDQ